MNIGSLIGSLVGIMLIGFAIYMGVNEIEIMPIPEKWGIFISIPSLMIVLGGSMAASMISYEYNTLSAVARSMFVVLFGGNQEFAKQKSAIVRLAIRATEGNVELERAVRGIKNPFLRDGIQMLADNYSVEEIEDILGQRIEFRLRKERSDAEVIRTIAKFCPAFGMTGTLIGLINMLSRMSFSGDAMSHIGADMAVALVTTFYGLLLAYLFFIPVATKLEKRTEDEVQLMRMIIDSVRMINEKWHPRKVEDYLNSYLPPEMRRRAKRLQDY